MLSLQTFTKCGWFAVGMPFEPRDTQRVQQAAVVLFNATGAVWRIVGSSGDVLALWDGRRWHAVAEAQPAPAPAPAPSLVRFWHQEPDHDPTTVPLT